MIRFRLLGAFGALVLGLLAGCGSSGGGGGGNLLSGCAAITGGGTRTAETIGATCAGCDVTNSGQAIDGNGASFATLVMPDTASGTVALRAIAQDGVVFAAGSRVGMVHSISYGTSTGLAIVVRTFLDGMQQEQFNFSTGSGSSDQAPSEPGRASYTTVMQYDAVELDFTRAAGSGPVNARVHAFCAN